MSNLTPELRKAVEDRANACCEFCGIAQEKEPFFRFHVDHIVARQHGGTSTSDNLALACHFCNRHNGPNLSSVDPSSGALVRLFHPRSDLWSDHFDKHGDRIAGRTAIGRATAALLRMNASNRRALR